MSKDEETIMDQIGVVLAGFNPPIPEMSLLH